MRFKKLYDYTKTVGNQVQDVTRPFNHKMLKFEILSVKTKGYISWETKTFVV